MAIYRATIHKTHADTGEKWINAYDIQVFNLDEAQSSAVLFRDAEVAVSTDEVHFDLITLQNIAVKLDRRRISFPGTGALAVTGLGGRLPLFLTVRVDFPDAVKRPERKYLRLGSQRNHLELGRWSTEYKDFVDANYSTVVFGELTFVGPGGERPTTYITQQEVQNRQLGWHRRHRPGFKRGWVPA